MELNKACEEAHEGAVLLHQGETYLVNSLDLKQMTAEVTQKDVDYYTQVLKETEISIRGEQQPSCKRIGDFCISLGEVDVTEHYLGYLVKRYEKVIGHHALKLPPVEFDSTALWFTVPRNIENKIKGKGLDFAGGLHALEHALIAMTPFYAMCDRWDIGGVSTEHHIDTGEATIFIYDAHQGGVGIAEKAYTLFSELLRSTRELIRDCACTDGCPSCAYSPKCGNRNEPMDKRAALCILDEIASNMAKGQSKENG
jgi:DEAD/DEAH box helicase domain-containing protein